METFLSIATMCQALAAVVTFALLFIKPIRYWFLGVKEHKAERAEKEAIEKESIKCLLRNEITHIYYSNLNKRTLHSYEHENITLLYNAYKKMGGNSFVDKIWNEIKGWDIIP